MALTRYSASPVGNAAGASLEGAYIELVSSTPYDSSRFHLMTSVGGGASLSVLLDIATGAASSETVIVSDILTYYDPQAISGQFTTFTVDIPAGTRIAARVRTSVASASGGMSILLEDRALASISNPVTYGGQPTLARGTAVDPGAVVSTKGAYTQLTASTTADIDALVICFATGDGNGVPSLITWNVDIATGAASAETIIIPHIGIVSSTGGFVIAPRPGIVRFPVSIPAGTRLSVRCQSNNNNAAQRILGVVLIGMQEPAASSLLSGESIQFSVVRPD